MQAYDFIIGPCDTDSISFCKSNMTPFTKEERQSLLQELNKLSPDKMVWEDDGMYRKILCLKAKNYITLGEDGKVKIKGSAIKDQKREPAVREFLLAIVDAILFEKHNYQEIYLKYIREIMDVKDIRRWSSKKTLTSTVIEGTRTNETKVMDAIEGEEFSEGDKLYLYYKSDETLALADKFDGDYHKERLLKKIFTASKVFDAILGKNYFINYSLKRNQKELDKLL